MSAPAAKRTVVRLPRERRVNDILEAAHAVFTERGYEAAAMSEIAERAGVVEGTIYKYFESKRDLMFQVMARWYEGMVADYADQLAGIRGTRNRLRFVIWRHVRSIEDNPALCRVFFREIRTAVDYDASVFHEHNRRYTHFVVQILREGMANGELRADTPVALVRDMIFGGVEHHTWNYVCGRGRIDANDLADRLTDMVLAGIAVPAPPMPAPTRRDAADPLVERLDALVRRLERAIPPDGGGDP
jgi:AcrR family transcriptional regulator